MAQIVPGSDNEQYVWDKATGSLQKVLVSDASPILQPKIVNEPLGINSESLKQLLSELKIPLYLVGAGIGVIILILLLKYVRSEK